MPRDLFHGVSEQSKASKHRRDDAQALLNSVRWRGAMYLAGYSVECLLKAKFMRRFDCRHLRELEEELRRRNLASDQDTIYTHHLERLLKWADGFDRLRRDRALWPLFTLVNQWIPAWRYNPDLSNREDAEDFLDAVDQVMRWIENNV
jgi:HEPN domain-containing protein